MATFDERESYSGAAYPSVSASTEDLPPLLSQGFLVEGNVVDPPVGSKDAIALPTKGDDRVGENDVLLGRGLGTYNHIGNIKFRKLVNEHKMRYLACSKVDKPKVAKELVRIWRKLDPPGRFLQRIEVSTPSNAKATDWYEVAYKKAQEKASQCLRERTPDVLPYYKIMRACKEESKVRLPEVQSEPPPTRMVVECRKEVDQLRSPMTAELMRLYNAGSSMPLTHLTASSASSIFPALALRQREHEHLALLQHKERLALRQQKELLLQQAERISVLQAEEERQVLARENEILALIQRRRANSLTQRNWLQTRPLAPGAVMQLVQNTTAPHPAIVLPPAMSKLPFLFR